MDDNERELYESMRTKSLKGMDGTFFGYKIVDKNKFNRAMAFLIAGASVAVGIPTYKGIKYAMDDIYINKQTSMFSKDVISKNTHRTKNNNGYWYDYKKIAKEIENSDDYEKYIYFCERAIGPVQTAKVLEETRLNDLKYYTSKSFKRKLRKKILDEKEIENQIDSDTLEDDIKEVEIKVGK